jgi:DNA topoisomerase I
MAEKTTKKTTKKAAKKTTGVGKSLVIVESAAKAKTINRYLGSDFVVKASVGHVRDLPKSGMGVDLEGDFTPTYEILDGRSKVITELKKLAAKAPMIYLATDLDREGEAIAWHLAEILASPTAKFQRVVFNEITATAIRAAFDTPRELDMYKVDAQQARRILDRVVGYELSPILWRKVMPGLSAGRVQSVAVRVIVDREREIDAFDPSEYWTLAAIFTPDADQTTPLGVAWREFLAQTDDEGKSPTKQDQIAFLGERGLIQAELMEFAGEKFRPGDPEAAQLAAEALGFKVLNVKRTEDPKGKGVAANRVTLEGEIADPSAVTVASLSQRERSSKPPAPFITATLQQSASTRLHFSVTRTMRTAQGLYEGVELPGEGTTGLITYMRTDSRHVSQDAINAARAHIGERFGDAYLPEKPNYYSSDQRAQEAHEAVRPTDPARTPESLKDILTSEQYRLYDLIWKQFVASQMLPARWNVTEAKLLKTIDRGDAVFRAVGQTLLFDGFMKVAGIPKAKDPILPPLEEAQDLYPVEIAPTQHFTQPPPRYTEAALVKVLKAEGIGRPSTYGSIIQTIQDRKYAELENRAFKPTDLGLIVTDRLVKHFPDVLNVQFTAQMEDNLDRIEDEHLDWVALLKEFYGPFHTTVEAATEEMTPIWEDREPSEHACPQCEKPLEYRHSRSGRYLACTTQPECDYTCPVDDDGNPIHRREVDVPCPQCGAPMMVRKSRWGVFLGCTKYPDCKGTLQADKNGNPKKIVKPEDVHATCPDCDKPMAVKFKGQRAFLACTGYPKCRTTEAIPDDIAVEAPPRPEPKDAGVGCNKCGRPMLIRVGPRGEFLACSGFPKCRNAMNLDKLDDMKAMAERGEIPEFKGEPKKAAKKKTAKKTAKKAVKKAAKKTTKKTTKKTAKKATKKAPAESDAPVEASDDAPAADSEG